MTSPHIGDMETFRLEVQRERAHDLNGVIPRYVDPLLAEVERVQQDLARARSERIVSATFASRQVDCPRPFALYRRKDVTGASGTGTVAYGVQFADGTVVVRWCGDKPSIVVWKSLADALAVHGHDGHTDVVWLSENFSDLGEIEAALGRLMRAAEEVLTEAENDFRESGPLKALRQAILAAPADFIPPTDNTTGVNNG